MNLNLTICIVAEASTNCTCVKDKAANLVAARILFVMDLRESSLSDSFKYHSCI